MTYIERAIGIDLGTTNSEIAMLEPSERDILVYQDKFKRRTVPSAVAWDPQREDFVVGRDARKRRGRESAPVESIKRKMGRDERVAVGPHRLSPEEVSAKILGELASRMQGFLQQRAGDEVEVRVQRAVITVPAYFDAPQVEATRRAAELAGLDAIGILQEPTAAAMYHTWKRQLGDGSYLVYDLGGGTFDVSILRCVGGEYQVLAIDGDNFLGGDDLDRRFAEHLRKQLVARGYALELDVRGDAEDRRRFGRLVHLAQEIKESLSTRDVIHVSKTNVVDDKDGEEVEIEEEIGRDDYERVTADLVETTITCSLRALAASEEKAGVGLADIDRVILVGGSTRVPLVVRRVTEALCVPSKADAPLVDEVDTCVALGAAIHAAQIGGLRIGDERASVLCSTPLVAKKSPIDLALRVEQAPTGVTEVAILRDEQSVAAAPIGDGLTPVRLAVPLAEAEEQRVTLALRTADEEILSALPLALYRGDVRPRASALSRPAVIAKDISLEVVRAGRRERRVLMPRGTGLPMKVKQTFFSADQSGAVVLRLLQGRLPIKTLVVEVDPKLPVGTPVELDIRCDEAMRLEARANVAGAELWATIEPPKRAEPDPSADVEGLLEAAESVRRSQWGARGDFYRRETETLSAAIREVVNVDPDKLAVLCQRLQALVDELRGDETGGGLAPPLDHFEWELDGLRRVVYRAKGHLMGMDRDAWEARIKDLEERARQAYDAVDAVAWRRICNEVQALRETAHQEEFAEMRLDDPAYVRRRHMSLAFRGKSLQHQLADLVISTSEEVRTLQAGERDRLLAAVQQNVIARLEALNEADASADTRRALERIDAELDRLELAAERIPSLGLVTEHGG